MAVIRYTRRNLIPGEQIVYAGELHMMCFLFPVLLLLIGTALMCWPFIAHHLADSTQQLTQAGAERYDDITGRVSEHFSFITAFIPQSAYDALESANELRQLSFGLLFLLVGVLSFLGALIRKTSTEQVITNKKIIHKQGFIKVDESEISLHNLEGVKVFQGVFDRLIGRGTVQVNGVGMEQLEIKGIRDPNRFRHHAYTAAEKFVQRHH